jgi:hypothetical protein
MRLLTILALTVATLAGQPKSSQPGDENHSLRDPRRDPWQKPDQVISALNFSETETVAVIENGYPYFAPRIAPLVQKVYAVNIDPRAFEGRGKLPPGVSGVVANKNSANIARLNVDTVMMVDVLRFVAGFGPDSDSDQPQDRSLYYNGIVAGLKPGGRLVIIDRNLPDSFPVAARKGKSDVTSELPTVGFSQPQEFTFLPYQYFLVFRIP